MKVAIDRTRWRLSASADDTCWRFTLFRKGARPFAKELLVPLSGWPEAANAHAGVPRLLALADAGEATQTDDGLALTHARVAALSRPEAAALELPPPAPFTLFLSCQAPVTAPAFQIRVEWFERGGGPVFVPVLRGTRLQAGGKDWLVGNPLFPLLKSIEAVNAFQGEEDFDPRMVAYAAFQQELATVTGDVRADRYIQGLVLHHATGFGIDLQPGQHQPLVPTLYGERPADPATEENEEVEHRREPLLPGYHAKQFGERFSQQGSRRHYALGDGVYAVLDAPVTAALEVVARVNRGGETARAAFRTDPMAFLIPAIEAAGGDGGIVCDLRGYGERVIGIGRWEQVKLSLPLPVARQWFPEEGKDLFTVGLPDGSFLPIRRAEVAELQQAIDKARGLGEKMVRFGGQSFAPDEAFEKTIQGLTGYVRPAPEPDEGLPAVKEEKEGTELKAAIIKENFEALAYNRALARNPHGRLRPGIPSGLRNNPKPHQRDGIRWLQAGYLAGAPGLLLADDMGLGKTFEVLAFLHWLRSAGMVGKGRPLLIVAPKTLLGNWLEELEMHLGPDALGRELRVYEQGLRGLKVDAHRGNDLEEKRSDSALDWKRIEDADWILTTYETLRDYHLSFGKVRFSVAVYDEAQKLKNPTSLMSLGAKAQQPNFTLMMTGTPIENGIIDLWALFDVAWPGFLGLSARDFRNQYGDGDPVAREELKQRLIEPKPPLPAAMLRRFKVDILEGLPERSVNEVREPMLTAQRLAYDAVVSRVRADGLPAIAGLQALRVVSLHPDLANAPSDPAQDDVFIAASARFRVLFRILDDIHAKREKALVFVELRDAQSVLAGLIQRRYTLPTPQPKVINGETAAWKRDEIRKGFQSRPGFDVLLLGPKAAGFGLTLTAANHVIHLNRWWNPAVEDQCSDRVYRIGATKPVNIHLPLAVHPELGDQSFDCLLHELLEEKRALSREIVVPVQFGEEDFSRLFNGAMGGDQTRQAGLLEWIDNMDWQRFEDWVANELRKAGWSVRKTPSGRDGGADIVADTTSSAESRLIVQCKHRSRGANGEVDKSAVEELLTARRNYDAGREARLIAITNGRFTSAAQSAAVEKRVVLIGRDLLASAWWNH
jgi:HJR/Mrr/RecB family endonuclease